MRSTKFGAGKASNAWTALTRAELPLGFRSDRVLEHVGVPDTLSRCEKRPRTALFRTICLACVSEYEKCRIVIYPLNRGIFSR